MSYETEYFIRLAHEHADIAVKVGGFGIILAVIVGFIVLRKWMFLALGIALLLWSAIYYPEVSTGISFAIIFLIGFGYILAFVIGSILATTYNFEKHRQHYAGTFKYQKSCISWFQSIFYFIIFCAVIGIIIVIVASNWGYEEAIKDVLLIPCLIVGALIVFVMCIAELIDVVKYIFIKDYPYASKTAKVSKKLWDKTKILKKYNFKQNDSNPDKFNPDNFKENDNQSRDKFDRFIYRGD
ncbi:hypothetical protein [Helicobacter sp. 11S02596-1]|uniref:hypothetical protein n=1 Tax=Helicobacter sp. 11S02596-1 TaxID=1476194 RepID=UPI000BA53CD3|nr:hypothetical protein [Helicobacter sp. 11S02596-1]PAF41044.1 hypothetical protein BJI48_09150 [Helicobacter sp. 11S02596-1]